MIVPKDFCKCKYDTSIKREWMYVNVILAMKWLFLFSFTVCALHIFLAILIYSNIVQKIITIANIDCISKYRETSSLHNDPQYEIPYVMRKSARWYLRDLLRRNSEIPTTRVFSYVRNCRFNFAAESTAYV